MARCIDYANGDLDHADAFSSDWRDAPALVDDVMRRADGSIGQAVAAIEHRFTFVDRRDAASSVASDLNDDRHTDLVWRNTATGANTVWYLTGTSLTDQASLTTVPDMAWQIGAIADVNGDTLPDVVWRNAATGANTVWYLNGATFLSQASLPSVPDLAWRIVAAADIDGERRGTFMRLRTAAACSALRCKGKDRPFRT